MADQNSKKPARKGAPAAVQFGVPSAAPATAAPSIQDALDAVELSADIAAVAPIAITTPAVELPTATIKEEPVTETTTTTAETVANTATTAANSMSNNAGAMFQDMTARAKDMFAKAPVSMTEVVDFNKGNVEALVQSARTAATGWQNIAAYTVDYAKTYIATANENTKRLAAVKSPTEFAQVGQEIAKANLDEAVAQVSKFTEGYLKLVGEIVQPLSNRYALAAEKVKTSVNA